VDKEGLWYRVLLARYGEEWGKHSSMWWLIFMVFWVWEWGVGLTIIHVGLLVMGGVPFLDG